MKSKEEVTDMLLCSHCPKEFRYKSEKKRHELSHFPRFECEICSKKFSFVSALRRHKKQHERTGSVKCQNCNRKFRDDVLLQRHIKYAHKGTFACKDCESTFSSELALRTHTKTHKPESERRFKCSHEGCTKSFNFSHHLKHHELTHTNAKQHYCSACGKGFIQSHHLKTHMKSHDPAEWLYCEISRCKKRFSNEYARKRHMITHKSKPDSGISSDSNSCDASTTSKEFTEVPVLCSTCGETVSQNDYETHASMCNIGASKDAINNDSNSLDEDWPDSPFKPNDIEDKYSTESIVERDSKCDIMLGCTIERDCSISANDAPNKENDSTNIENFDIVHDNNNKEMFDDKDGVKPLYNNDISKIVDDIKLDIVKVSLTDYNENEKDICEGCDCANICNDKISMYLAPEFTCKPPKIDAPSIEYRNDGVVKIKDTFDYDIVLNEDKNVCRFIPMSNCKDAVGNCLVVNGEGCLCARMMAEDQAIFDQEMDDITPQPNDPV